MHSTITKHFVLLLGLLMLSTQGLVAQVAQGEYQRTGSQTPRQYLLDERDLQTRYPLLQAKPASPREYFRSPVRSNKAVDVNRRGIPRRAENQAALLYGSVMSSSNWSAYDIPAYGIYTVPLTTAETTAPEKIGDDDIQANGGGVLTDSVYNWINYYKYSSGYQAYYQNASVLDWQEDAFKRVSPNYISTDMAYDENTGIVVGCCYNASFTGFELVELDFGGLTRRVIKDLGNDRYVGLAFNNEGVLYGIRPDGNLYIIDVATGEATLVGSLDVQVSTYAQSATFDPSTDKLYFSYLFSDTDAGLYEVDTTTGHATLVTRYANNEQLVGIFIPQAEAAASAPAAPANLVATFENNSTTGSLTFTMPSKTHDGSALTGDLSYTVKANGKSMAQGSAEASTSVTVPLTVQGGMTRFTVYASNDAGNGDEASLRQWIGYDAPDTVSNVSLSIDANGKAIISWEAPALGAHGGAIDKSGLTYDVTRLPDNVNVASGITDTFFIDQLPDTEMTKYSYRVTALNNGVPGISATSNEQIYGSHFYVPYIHTFSGTNALDFYNVIDANNDGTTWELADDNKSVEYSPSFWSKNDADDWLIVPALQLSNDRTYSLSLSFSLGQYFSQTEVLSALLGKGTTADAFTDVVFKDSTITGTGDQLVNVTFRVKDSGDYNLGLHLTSTADDGGTVTLNGIAVRVEATDNAPAAISDLSVKPGDKGELKSTVSLTSPTKNVVGADLQGPLTITVVRDDSVLVAKQDNVSAGQKLSFEDTGMSNGIHRYVAYASNEDGRGMTAEASAFIGVDIPLPSTNVLLRETGDDQVHVSWTPASMGVNGGYVNPDSLAYSVRRSDGAYMSISQKGATGFDDTESSVSLTYRQSELSYNVFGSNAAGESDRATSNTIIIGVPYDIPFVDHFSFYGSDNSGWHSVNYGGGSFRTPNNSLSADGDNGCAIFTPKAVGDSSDFISSKIDVSSAENPGVRFSYYAYPGTDAKLVVKAEQNQNGEPVTIGTIDFSKLSGVEGWRDTTFIFANNSDARYVQIHFLATSNDLDTPVAIDAVEVRDQVSFNLSADLSVNGVLTAGQQNDARVKVRNLGLNDASDFTVQLVADNKVVVEVPGGNLAAGKDSTYTLAWAPAIADTGAVSVYAVAKYDADTYQDDNTTESQDVQIVLPQYPAISLNGESSDNGAVLKWNEPELFSGSFTDDFEDYQPWLTTGIGNWTTVDGDGGATYGLSSVYSWSNVPKAWIVMNFDSLDDKGLMNEENLLEGHSGVQYLASFASNYMDAVYCEDWLISPNISSESTGISFWARQINNNNEAEWLTVKYSTTDSRTTSFMPLPTDTTITDLTTQWKEYNFTLPEGTKYFALENVAPTSGNAKGYPFAILLDDVTYTPIENDLTVVGYHVYRDGKLIATLSADDLTYTDASAVDGKEHTYQVTVVYNLGESPLSNAYTVSITSGITNASTAFSVVGHDGVIEIHGAAGEPVTVYAVNGAKIARQENVEHTVIPVPAGTYLVAVGEKTVKVIVK